MQTRHSKTRHWLAIAAIATSAAAITATTLAGAAWAQPAPMADGEVRKVDLAQAKVTLRHGPIAHLDMQGMTMVFKVADPKLLDGLKPGDKVRFSATSENGNITVTAIEPVR